MSVLRDRRSDQKFTQMCGRFLSSDSDPFQGFPLCTVYTVYINILFQIWKPLLSLKLGESPITMYRVLITARYIVNDSVMWSFSACFTTGMKKITQKAPDERVLIRYWRQLISFLPYSVTFPLELLSHYVFLAGCWSNQIHSTSPL